MLLIHENLKIKKVTVYEKNMCFKPKKGFNLEDNIAD
jgi:hypothetical protein